MMEAFTVKEGVSRRVDLERFGTRSVTESAVLWTFTDVVLWFKKKNNKIIVWLNALRLFYNSRVNRIHGQTCETERLGMFDHIVVQPCKRNLLKTFTSRETG